MVDTCSPVASSRLPRLKLSLNGQKRSYSLTNLACKKWFSDESLPSKLLKRSFHKSRIPEPRETPQPVYRSLRSSNINKSSHSLPRLDETDYGSNELVNNYPKCGENEIEPNDSECKRIKQLVFTDPLPLPAVDRPPWKPAGPKVANIKSPTTSNGPVERIRTCCRLMKQNAVEKDPKRRSTKSNSRHQIDLLKRNIEAQQEEIEILQGMIKFQNEKQINENDSPLTGNCKSLDFNQSKLTKSENASLGYHSMNSEYGINKPEIDLSIDNEMLRMELQESRDHSELLEFRILEFTEGIQRVTVNSQATCERATCTSTDNDGPLSTNQILLSLCSDYEEEQIENNAKNRLKGYQKVINTLDASLKPEKRSMISPLNDLLEWASILPQDMFKNLSPVRYQDCHDTSSSGSSFKEDQDEDNLSLNLTLVAARLQESLSDSKSQETAIQETIAKLRDFDLGVSQLYSRLGSLAEENKGLQEALAALHDSQETRTEASGTESELVNAKTMQSDISDAESDESPRPQKLYNYEPVNASTQTSKDQYEEREFNSEIILAKEDYDEILDSQRRLQVENENLRIDRDEICAKSTNLETQLRIANSDTCRDAAEVLRAEMRLLEERLSSSDRLKRQFFDEKCEIEEEENDARLMAQRFESQLDAAREMESLLSASLSQEQEFSRELQRRVRDLQAIEKGREMHEESLEIENDALRYKELVLSEHVEYQSFTIYALIFAEIWRRIAAINPGAVVPYDDSCHSFNDNWETNTKFWLNNSNKYRISKPIEDVKEFCCIETQTDKCIWEECEERIIAKEDNLMEEEEIERTLVMNKTGVFYSPNKEEPRRPNPPVSPKKSVTDHKECKEQLECLQNELQEVKLNFEDSLKNNQNLSLKIDESNSSIKEMQLEWINHMKRLKNEYSTTIDQNKKEQNEMQRNYEEHIEELRRSSETHEQRFSSLLQQYSILQQELSGYLDNNDAENSPNTRITTTKDLLSAIRELAKSEQLAKQRIKDLEKQECAYRETIEEADRIMSTHGTAYAAQIEDLEGELEQKTLRIRQLETSEETLRFALKPTWTSNKGEKIVELHERLIETEKSELLLKQRVSNLERSGKELEAKAHESAMKVSELRRNEVYMKARIEELESSESTLKSSLKDRDQLIYQRDRKHREQISNHQEDASSTRNELEVKNNEYTQVKQSELQLKKQIEELKQQILELQNDLGDASSLTMCNESQHRSEVARLRLQLKVVNGQLTDLDSLNEKLRNGLEESEFNLKKVTDRLEEQSQAHEKEMISLNIQLEQKTSKLEEYETEVPHLTYASLMEEFHYLKSSLLQLQTCLQNFIDDSSNCEECARSKNLTNLTNSLQYLVKLVNNRVCQTDSEDEDIDNCRTTKRSLLTSADSSESKQVTISCLQEEIKIQEQVPSVPPRPRRDAKVKSKKFRNSSQNKDSILQELEESSSELGLVNDYRLPSENIIEDLEENVKHCEDLIKEKDRHLELADLETNELHTRLIEEKTKQANKIEEVNQANKALASIKEELTTALTRYKATIQTLQEKYEIDLRAMNQKTELLEEDLQRSSESARGKEKIILKFVDVMGSSMKCEDLKEFISQIRSFDGTYSEISKIDLENVCQRLKISLEKRLSELSSTTEKSTHLSSKRNSEPGCEPQCKHNTPSTRIPRFKNSAFVQVEESGSQDLSRSMHRLYTESAKYINKQAGKMTCNCEQEIDLKSSYAQKPPTVPIRKILRSSSVGSIDKKSFMSESRGLNHYDVPKPKNLRITRRVGTDGAFIAWTPLEDSNVAGFQVILGGIVVQVVRSPHRTKALVNGLKFNGPFTIALVTVTKDGRCSTPALITHKPDPTKDPKLRRSASMPVTTRSKSTVSANCL